MQVMANLLSNRFSPSGGEVDITVEEGGRARESGGDRPRRRHSRGISRPHFRTVHAGRSNKRRTGGTGLGLSISAAIVEAHKGVLDFEIEVDKGTTSSSTSKALIGAVDDPEHGEPDREKEPPIK